MNELASLRPTQARRVMDLVRDAGVGVSDWANFAGGVARAWSNPRYCYEWAFTERDKLVVLNIWFRDIRCAGGVITLEDNLRESAAKHARARNGGSAVWQRRARSFDEAVAIAAAGGLPIRVIVCDGILGDLAEGHASQVKARALDPVPWAVTSYDPETGDFQLTRGARHDRLIDQFVAEAAADTPTEVRLVSGVVFVRDPQVRHSVLALAAGRCEWCHQPAFTTALGEAFLETHHVVPLSEGGADVASNVVALCPNHHREAHLGSARESMRERMLQLARGREARSRVGR